MFELNLDGDDLAMLRSILRHVDVVELATADLDAEGKHLLGLEAKVLVLRPDGYIGFRSKAGYQAELIDYARQDALV